MTIEIFCLCKSYSVNQSNQLSLVDIFDKKIAAGEPALIDPFVAVASIRFYKTEIGNHRFQFIVRDQVGRQLVTSTEIVTVTSLPEDSTTYFMPCHMGQTGLMFGRYDFSIEAGGKQLARTPLYVIRETNALASYLR